MTRRRKKAVPRAKRLAQIRADLGMADPESDPASNPSPTSKRARSKSPVEGVVYLLQAGSYFKIGKSIDFEKRLGQIKLQLPYAVEVVHTMRAADPSRVEAHWHRRFASLRRNGEWFLLTQAEVDEFKSVNEM